VKASSRNVLGDGVDTNADNPFLASFPYIAADYDHAGHE
jgi:hypothetical protein